MTIIFQTAEYGAQTFLTKSITTSLSCNASPLQIPPPPRPPHLSIWLSFDSLTVHQHPLTKNLHIGSTFVRSLEPEL